MMSQETPSRKLDQYIVRFPDGMRDTLKAEAAKNNRSLNAEIVARLEQSLALDPQYDELQAQADETDKRVKMLEEAFRNIAELLESPKKKKSPPSTLL